MTQGNVAELENIRDTYFEDCLIELTLRREQELLKEEDEESNRPIGSEYD